MGRKGGKFKSKEDRGVAKKKSSQFSADDEDMMNDEIDAFHKSRDIVPLNISNDMEDSDEDNEHPVYDIEDDEDDDDDDEDEDEDEDKDEDEDEKPNGLAAKIVRTQKYLRSKSGGDDDEQHSDADEEDQEKSVWNKKGYLHGTDVANQSQSNDDEDQALEEAEAKKLQSAKLKVLSLEDFGLNDASEDETNREPTLEEILDNGKPTSKASLEKGTKDEDGMTFEVVKKDLNAFTKEEQIDIVYSSAPELIGLLSELKDALEQLEKVNPLVNKIRGLASTKKGGMHYLEVKQLLLQSFCQAITFYLLLKSEGQPVRDHPVVSRLVEIKSLLDKVKEMDEKLPFDVEDILNHDANDESAVKLVDENIVLGSDSLTDSQIVSPVVSSGRQTVVEPIEAVDLNCSRTLKNTEAQRKNQDNQVGPQSMEMLKIRASLEEKLRQKGVFSSTAPKNGRNREHVQPVNRQLETLADFVDEPMDIDALASRRNNGDAGLRPTKRKVISGDDDIPKRDDIGERRRKHELRVLAGAGVDSVDAADVNGESDIGSDLEYYEKVEQEHAAKKTRKSDKYSRTTEVSPPRDDTPVDGKRHITHQIDKNRGLTRARKKLIKNPRKKYKLKHQKAEIRRKGQVREIRKAPGHYGGEASGINADVSRSRRFGN